MRPVERGTVPIVPNSDPPVKKTYRSYGNARRDLIERMGQYCSYCETRLNTSLAVEHVQPKSLVPGLELSWDNFLLACTNCNSTKGDTPITIADFFWPDLNNTCILYNYLSDGKIEVSNSITQEEQTKAQKMLDLVGLQKYQNTSSASDRRWINRKEAYDKAIRSKVNLEKATRNGVRDEFIELLIDAAFFAGFFSVWLTVYQDQKDVIKALIEGFTGTHQASFDTTNQLKLLKRTQEM